VEFVNIGSYDLAKRLRRLFRDGKPNKLNPAQFAKMTCWNSACDLDAIADELDEVEHQAKQARTTAP